MSALSLIFSVSLLEKNIEKVCFVVRARLGTTMARN